MAPNQATVQPISPDLQRLCQHTVLPTLWLMMSGMLMAADVSATPREGTASTLHPPA